MIIDSCGSGWQCDHHGKLHIYVLQVCDRDRPDDQPIAWLLVERQEKYVYDESDHTIDTATICLNYQQLQAKNAGVTMKGGNFVGSFARSGNAVSLTSSQPHSHGGVFMDPPELRGQRIGTHFLNEIVIWAQQWPDATVRPIELVDGQADDGNKTRRNHFYEQFGLEFDYHDHEHRQGLSKPMPAGQLTPVDKWKLNLEVIDVREYLADLLYANEQLETQMSQRNRAIKYWTDEVKNADARPLRYAWNRTWPRVLPIAPLLVIGAASLVYVYTKFLL